MSWHQERMACLDFETTGTDPFRDRIVTAALIEVGAGAKTQTHTWLIDPGIEIPDGAAAIHGITTEEARRNGRPAVTAIQEIGVAVLSCTKKSGMPIVGHNVSYDLTMLRAELVRHGHIPLANGVGAIRPVIDTLVLDKWADKWRKGSRKLVDVARHYGVQLTDEEAHGAEADALAAGRIAWHIANRWPGAQGDARTVHDWLIDEKRQQADSFGAYLVKQGKPDDVARSWPIQDFPADWTPDQLPAAREDVA